MRPVRSLQIPPEVGKSPTDFTDIHRFFLGRFFCHADFADDADFFSWDFIIGRHGIYSEISCCGDYSRNFADATCPVVADTPEVGKCPTDFTDIHRFFSHGIFIHRMTRNLFRDFLLWRLLTDFRGCDLSGRCRYPLRLDKEIHQRFHRKSVYICEICGTKPSHEEKSASSAKSA